MDEYVAAAEAAAKKAKQLVVLAGILVAVMAAVVVIDQGIKKSILAEGLKVRGLLGDIRAVVEEVDETQAAGETGGPAGAALNGSHGVVHDAPAGAVLDEAEGAAGPA